MTVSEPHHKVSEECKEHKCHTCDHIDGQCVGCAQLNSDSEHCFWIPRQTAGFKKDSGKARFDLIPPEALFELGIHYTKAAEKYPERNWEAGMSWGRIFAAMMRHAVKWLGGEKIDPENGQSHLIAVAWGALALRTYEIRGIGEDDRK